MTTTPSTMSGISTPCRSRDCTAARVASTSRLRTHSGKPPSMTAAGKIDDGGRGDDGLGESRSAILDPDLQRLAVVDPVARRNTRAAGCHSHGRAAGFSSTKIEAIFRSCTVLPCRFCTGSGPSEPAVPVRPEKQRRIQHDAATDEGADEEIDEIRILRANAEDQFGGAGARGIVFQKDR